MNEDPRYLAIRQSLNRLTITQLRRIIGVPADRICLDSFNYDASTGNYCPLCIAVGIDVPHKPGYIMTNDKAIKLLNELAYPPMNLSGIKGTFYTTNRYNDLMKVVTELIDEKRQKLTDTILVPNARV